MKVTPVSIVILILLSGIIGPLSTMAEMPGGALTDSAWWTVIGEQAIRGIASGGLAAVAVIASAYGIEVRNRMKEEKSAKAAEAP